MFLPPKVAKSFGELGPLMLCTRVSAALHLIDPFTLRSIHLDVRLPLCMSKFSRWPSMDKPCQ